MIRPIDIRLNAAHPEIPLVEATTFTGAPSSVFIRGVPKTCGNWSITAVNVAVTYPDNTTTTRAAVESAEGVWVATIPGTATSGRTAAGFRVLADGIDENGAAVTGYVLGFADFSVLSFAPVPAPGGTFWYLRYFDTMPTTPKKGDVALVSNVLKYYDGTAWQPFADLSNYYTAEQTDEAIERVAAYYITYTAAGAAFPTAAALLNATTVYSGGVVRVPTRNDYAVVLADETHGGAEWRYIYAIADGATSGQWEAQYPIETNDYTALSNKPSINGNTLSGDKTAAQLGLASTADATLTERGFSAWTCNPSEIGGRAITIVEDQHLPGFYSPYVEGVQAGETKAGTTSITWDVDWIGAAGGITLTATRTALQGYQLGSQTTKPVASEAEAEALRTAVAGKMPSSATGADILVGGSSGASSTSIATAIDDLFRIKADIDSPTFIGTPVAPTPQAGDNSGLVATTAFVAGEIHYSFNSATVGSGTTPTVTNVLDRGINAATLGNTVTAATIMLPAATSGKARDFFINLTIEASNAPTLTFLDPATSTTADVQFGSDSLADITPGYNLVLFTEIAANKFLVSVKHEDAQ